MAHRQRFTKDEKAAFTVGAAVQWQNGSHWHDATVVEAPSQDPEFGWWRMGVTHQGRQTATISPGQYVQCSPGKVRVRETA